MCADGSDMIHLPRPRLVPVGSARECSNGTDIDASAAFVALEVIALVRNDFGRGPAVPDSESVYAKPFAADTDATIAENASRRIVEDDGRPLLLVDVDLRFAKA